MMFKVEELKVSGVNGVYTRSLILLYNGKHGELFCTFWLGFGSASQCAYIVQIGVV